MTIYINGKFVAQATTGVQRVAASLVTALDTLPEVAKGGWVLLHPRGVVPPRLGRIGARPVGAANLPPHVWEQLVLPWAARDGMLLNLAGSAPAFARRQLCEVHDAAVFDDPVTYTRQFRVWYRCMFQWLAWRRVPFLTVSEFSRLNLMRHLKLDASDIAVLPNGADHLDAVVADPGVLHRLALQQTTYLLVVAGDSASKNLPRLLQAFSRLPPSMCCKLVMVGDANRRVFRQAACGSDPVGVLRAGRVADPELKTLYQHAAALVIPSLYEGFGLPVVEAMRLGCPVVASNAAALPEVCAGAALLFDPSSIDAITAALVQVLGDMPLRQRLRKAGQQRTEALSWQMAARQLHGHVAGAIRP